jgi:hypothetical protein
MHQSWLIAGKKVKVKIHNSLFPAAWLNLFSNYKKHGDEQFVADLYLNLVPQEGWINQKKTEEIVFEHQRESAIRRIFIERRDFSGMLEQVESRYQGDLTVNADSDESVTVLVRTCLSFLCEDASALLLHASAVERRGHYWIFCARPPSVMGTG